MLRLIAFLSIALLVSAGAYALAGDDDVFITAVRAECKLPGVPALETSGWVELEKLAVKDPESKLSLALTLSLNATGGIPFAEDKEPLRRIKLDVTNILTNVSSMTGSGGQPVETRFYLYDLDGNGSRYLVAVHNDYMRGVGTSVWRKDGAAWTRVWLGIGMALRARTTASGTEFYCSISGFGDDSVSVFAYDKKSKTFIAHGLAFGKEFAYQGTGVSGMAAKPLVARAAWPSLKLLAAPKTDADVLAQVPAGGAVWKLGTKDGHMLVLFRKAVSGEWNAAFAGKIWQLGWMQNAE